MATIQNFENILAWQKARELVRRIYEISNAKEWAKDFSLKDQMRRAAVSSMSNIAEGFARRTDKDFSYFLNISHSSINEVQSLLYVALDQDYINEKNFQKVYNLALEVSLMVCKLGNHLRKNRN